MSRRPTKASHELKGARIEFLTSVKTTIANRVDRQCSVPRCKQAASGPFKNKSGAVNIGKACHIYSASENGPRGRGDKDETFIESAQNGIWCCAHHSDLIDKANGIDYPTEVLFMWKALAEARAAKRMNDSLSPLGWVDSVAFEQYPFGSHLPEIHLSAFTLVIGDVGVGKTSLLRTLAAVSHSKFIESFSERVKKYKGKRQGPNHIKAKVLYSTAETLRKEVCISVCGEVLKRTDGIVSLIIPPGDLEVIYCGGREEHIRDGEDDVDFLMRVLSIDQSGLLALIEIGGTKIMISTMRIQRANDWSDEEEKEVWRVKKGGLPHFELVIKIHGRTFYQSFASLSSSERTRLLVELLISKARETCKQRLTLLALDEITFSLDEVNFNKLLYVLADEDFQSVLTLRPMAQSNYVDIVDGAHRLKGLEHLRPWRLVVVKS